MKVVLFCGGKGLRIRNLADPLPKPMVREPLPKPMVPIGGRPLLWRIMEYYAHYGHNEFVLCLGYQAEVIEDYFRREVLLRGQEGPEWRITFVDTGLESSLGERLAAVREHVDSEEMFLANYGDTITDVPLPPVVSTLAMSGRVASLLSVLPNYTFNVVTMGDGLFVDGFQDIVKTGIRINGGYFVFKRDVFDYLPAGADLPEMLQNLIDADQLLAYPYDGFWAPMDTLKDKERLEELVAQSAVPWHLWDSENPQAELG